MDMTIDQQVALDEALVPHVSRLRIRKRNFRLRSDITSKESTLQLVYDVLRLTPFYKAFSVTADTFDELPFEEEILAFLRYLRHIGEIRKLTDNTQQFGAMLYVELTNEDIRISAPYKEYYAIASGADPPKTKASVRKTKSSSDTTITPPTATGTRLLTLEKGKQPAKSSKVKGISVLSKVAMTEAEQMKSDDQEDEDDQDDNDDQDDDDQADNDDDQDTDNDGDDFVHPKLSIHEEEDKDEESFDPIAAEDDDEELYRDVNINLEGQDVQMTDVHTTQEFKDTHVTLTPFTGAVSSILGIVERYMDQRMNEAVKTSYVVATDLSELELKKILIEKMESNKSIHRS
nr:hypothetical protein [Tanacetum cinerariifolium]